MSFGDAFDAHDLARTYERLIQQKIIRGLNENRPSLPFPRGQWPGLPNTAEAHTMRHWLDRLTVGDAEFLTGLGIDPLG